jgi:hypothetical protein
MAFKTKYLERSKIRSLRVSQTMFDFLQQYSQQVEQPQLTANDFIVRLITNSDDYKVYLRNKDNEVKQPALF